MISSGSAARPNSPELKRRSKRRVTIGIDEAVRRLDAITPILAGEIERALQQEATLEAANDVIKRRQNKAPFYGANAYNTVHAAMVTNLALTVSRLFDRGRKHVPRNRRDMASVPVLIDLLKQSRCRARLVHRARGWTPGLTGLADSHGRTCASAINSAISAYRNLRATHAGRRAMHTLQELRNKRLAHQLYSKEPKGLPRYDDLFRLIKVATAVIEGASLGVRGMNLDLKGVAGEFRRQADAFWEPAIKAAVASDEDSSL